MERIMSKRSIWILTALVLVLVQGCATYHSRYYYQPRPTPRCIGTVCVAARAFSYQDEKGNDAKWLTRDSFYVSFRVADESVKLTDEDLHKSPEERQVDAKAFRMRVSSTFAIDSLVLRDGALTRLRVLAPDTSRYTPQAANTFTVNFGWVKLPVTVSHLRTAMYLTRFDLGDSPESDSLLFDMDREESHEEGVELLRDNVRGYEE
jgi:hypothetical protein